MINDLDNYCSSIDISMNPDSNHYIPFDISHGACKLADIIENYIPEHKIFYASHKVSVAENEINIRIERSLEEKTLYETCVEIDPNKCFYMEIFFDHCHHKDDDEFFNNLMHAVEDFLQPMDVEITYHKLPFAYGLLHPKDKNNPNWRDINKNGKNIGVMALHK